MYRITRVRQVTVKNPDGIKLDQGKRYGGKITDMKTGLLTLIALSLFSIMAVSSDVSAQGRGRGRYNRGWDRKCEKFVNCHDARDGRWDRRGPRRGDWSRDRYYSPYYREGNYGNYSPYYREGNYGNYSPYYRDGNYGNYSPYYRDGYNGGYRLRRVYRPNGAYIRTYRRW
jgi:hypothetical protein